MKVTMAADLMGGLEAYVWLVWGVRKNGRCDLLVIATSDGVKDRYKEYGERQNQYVLIKEERCMLDHAFGMGMLPNALNKIRGGQ